VRKVTNRLCRFVIAGIVILQYICMKIKKKKFKCGNKSMCNDSEGAYSKVSSWNQVYVIVCMESEVGDHVKHEANL